MAVVRAAENFLEIRGLCVTYFTGAGKRLRALDDVDLAVGAGEIVAILGESGSGKSTLGSSLLRLLPNDARCESGEIIFRGRDLMKLPEHDLRSVRGREISLISQDPAMALNPVMAVGTQIAEVMRAHLGLTSRERRTCVLELLQEIGFEQPEEIYGAYPHQLSGGQRQRIVIAQAVACGPALIIADEPTSKLDASLRAEIIALLLKIRVQYGTAIMFITHEPGLLGGFADRVAAMYAGKIVEVGKCGDVLQRPLHPYTEALLRLARPSRDFAVSEGARRLPVIQGELPDPCVIATACSFEPRCSNRMSRCAREIPRELIPEPARTVSCFKYDE